MVEPKPQASQFSREVLDLFDGYVHGAIDRRAFLDQCALKVGSLAAAGTVLATLRPDFAHARVIDEGDRRIRTRRLSIPSPAGSGTIDAYIATPAAASRRPRKPVVLVVHENRGLNPHIEDIARRLAVHGFVAIAPDALTALGGYPGDEDKARAAFGKLDQAKIRADFVAATRFGETFAEGNGKIGAVGFCYGGGMVNYLATRVPGLRAAVAFYGPPAPLADVGGIRSRLMLHFAANDSRINGMWPEYEAALKKAGKRYAAFVYPGVEHGFNNDTTPRFDKAAAALAWKRTIDLFRTTLR